MFPCLIKRLAHRLTRDVGRIVRRDSGFAKLDYHSRTECHQDGN